VLGDGGGGGPKMAATKIVNTFGISQCIDFFSVAGSRAAHE